MWWLSVLKHNCNGLIVIVMVINHSNGDSISASDHGGGDNC
jgi:hypothetical protein